MERPLIASCKLELLDFEHEEGKAVFWHSSAHVLGEACEKHYGCHLCIGPPIEDGFYYEMAMKDERYVYLRSKGGLDAALRYVREVGHGNMCISLQFYLLLPYLLYSVVSQSDYANLETCAKNAIKEKQQFVRLEMKKEELLEMFKVG